MVQRGDMQIANYEFYCISDLPQYSDVMALGTLDFSSFSVDNLLLISADQM